MDLLQTLDLRFKGHSDIRAGSGGGTESGSEGKGGAIFDFGVPGGRAVYGGQPVCGAGRLRDFLRCDSQLL